jgi:hypothetical protein
MRALVGAATVLVLAASCVSDAPAPSGSASPTAIAVAVTDKTRADLQGVLIEREAALATKDLKRFQATIDVSRPAFRRCQQETFEIASRVGRSGGPTHIVKAEAYGDTYVRAYLDDFQGLFRLYFRRDSDRWILTEPKADELRGERSKTVSGVRVDYWGIDEDVVDMVGAAAAETRDYIKPYANSPLKVPYFVKLIPTRETAGIVGCNFTAFAQTRDENAPQIGLWKTWYSEDLRSVSDWMLAVFHHEGLHYLQDQFIHKITIRLDWWLIEGWPDFIAQTSSRSAIRAALCTGTLPTLKRLIDGVPTEPDTPPELTSQYYALANTLVDYVYATKGAQAYWDLLTLYKDVPDYRVQYPKVFGVEPDAFYASWLAYAKRKYC